MMLSTRTSLRNIRPRKDCSVEATEREEEEAITSSRETSRSVKPKLFGLKARASSGDCSRSIRINQEDGSDEKPFGKRLNFMSTAGETPPQTNPIRTQRFSFLVDKGYSSNLSKVSRQAFGEYLSPDQADQRDKAYSTIKHNFNLKVTPRQSSILNSKLDAEVFPQRMKSGSNINEADPKILPPGMQSNVSLGAVQAKYTSEDLKERNVSMKMIGVRNKAGPKFEVHRAQASRGTYIEKLVEEHQHEQQRKARNRARQSLAGGTLISQLNKRSKKRLTSPTNGKISANEPRFTPNEMDIIKRESKKRLTSVRFFLSPGEKASLEIAKK